MSGFNIVSILNPLSILTYVAGVSDLGNTDGTTGLVAEQMVLVGSNNITLSQSKNGQSITVSIFGGAGGGGGGGIAVAAGTQTATTNTVFFSNSNNVTFGMSGSTRITASFSQTNQSAIQALGVSNTGNTAGNTGVSTGINFVIAGSNGITASQSTVGGGPNTIWISGATQTNQSAIKGFGVSNTGQTAGNTGISTGVDWVLAGSQSITLSQSTVGGGPNTVWLQHPAWITTAMLSNAATISNINISAGTTSNNLSKLTFADGNGVSFGLNGSTITASVAAAGGAQTGISGIVVSDTTYTSGTVSFSNAGNITISSSVNGATQYIRLSGNAAQTTQSAIKGFGVSNTGNTLGNTGISTGVDWVIGGSGGITASQSTVGGGPNTVWLSVANTVAQTNQTVGLYALGNTTQNSSTTLDARTLSFNGLGGITVGYSNGSIQISGPQTAAQTNQTLGIYVSDNSTGQSSSSTYDARSLTIDALGVISAGWSGGKLILSVPSGGGAGDGVNIIAAGSQTAATTGTVLFQNSNNITFGMSNSSVVTASVSKGTMNAYQFPQGAPWQTNFSLSNMSFSLQHVAIPFYGTINRANLLMSLSGNTGSTGALTISLGIYSMSGSTLSLASSDSRQITWTSGSQTSASSLYGGISGVRYRSISLNNWSLTPGVYMVGMWYRTTNDGTWRHYGRQGPTIVGAVDANETNHYLDGFSTSSFSTAMPASLNVTDTNWVRTGGDAGKHAGFVVLGTF